MRENNNLIKLNLTNSYEKLPSKFYSLAKRANFSNPKLLIYNEKLAKNIEIDKDIEKLSEEQKANLFVGNLFPAEVKPISQAYAGHQFGYFTMLGDGRAFLLGEKNTFNKEKYDIHLKGIGRTPYSRGGDGKAVVGPMLREYLISEAMYALDTPTTRSLAVALTGEKVYRNELLPGAVLTRVASSHIRVGTFEFASMTGVNELKTLTDYTIKRHYPNIENDENPYQKLLQNVIEKQANLIAKWQLIGFIHGVMNTDNMTISGETIDYGPCAFMDTYDPDTVFSSIDKGGRYSFKNQPSIGRWNLIRFAETLLPMLATDENLSIQIAEKELAKYEYEFQKAYNIGMKKKLGFLCKDDNSEILIQNLLQLMYKNSADYTNTFVRLTLEVVNGDGGYLEGTEKLFKDTVFKKWKEKWKENIKLSKENKEDIYNAMRKANPFIIPRNHKVEHVLKKAEHGEMSEFKEFLEALKEPYRYDEKAKKYQKLAPITNIKYQTFCGT